MDFEMAIWEMTSLLIAPKKVFKSMYYHVCTRPILVTLRYLLLFTWELTLNLETFVMTYYYTMNICFEPFSIQKPNNRWRKTETKNTWHRPDPSFTYLLSFFLLLTALAWGLAYRPSFGAIIRLSLSFIFIHFIGSSLLISTIAYFTVGRIFGPNGPASMVSEWRGSRSSLGRVRRRGAAQGLFAEPGEKEQVEFGYCFDVSNPSVSELGYISKTLWL